MIIGIYAANKQQTTTIKYNKTSTLKEKLLSKLKSTIKALQKNQSTKSTKA